MTDYTITSPNGGTWTDQSANNPTIGRYHDLGYVMEGAAGAGNVFKQARPGILPGPPVAAGSNIPGAFAVAPTSGLNFSIQPAAALLERNTLSGVYPVHSTAVGTAAVGTADPTQTRIDLVTVDHFDGALGDNSSTTLTRVHVKAGTPGGGVPAADVTAGARTILGWWTIPALTTTLTLGMWTDARKSAGVRGGSRVLMPGDALTDPGFMPAERRQRYHATYGWLEDLWDPSGNSGAGVWRGTQELIVAQPAQVASGTLANNASVVVSSKAITDPGWPYIVECFILVDFASATAATVCQVAAQMDSSTFGTNRFIFDQEPAVAANASFDLGSSAAGNSFAFGGFTGAHTVYFMAKCVQGPGGPANITIYTNFYAFTIKLIPAGI